MSKNLLTLAVLASALTLSGAALAQSVGGGGAGGSSSGGIGSSSGGSGISGTTGSGIGGASGGGISGSTSGGATLPNLGGASNQVGSGGGSVGSSSTTTQERATQGSTTINSVNADAVARTGDVGAATTIGGTDDLTGTGLNGASGTTTNGFQSVAGTGPAALYNIPQARVNVDLGAIRSALQEGPNATPNARGF